MKLKTPERSYSEVYQDDRFKECYAINVRHADSVEIIRSKTSEYLARQQQALRNRGYKLARRGEK